MQGWRTSREDEHRCGEELQLSQACAAQGGKNYFFGVIKKLLEFHQSSEVTCALLCFPIVSLLDPFVWSALPLF